jgi:uncharacterized protein (TIGR03437 family)
VRDVGFSAPLLYVSPAQVNVQVPFEVAGQATAYMQITMPSSFSSVTETRDFSVTDRALASSFSDPERYSAALRLSDCSLRRVPRS